MDEKQIRSNGCWKTHKPSERNYGEKRERMNAGNNHKHQNGEPFLEQNYHDGPLFLTV